MQKYKLFNIFAKNKIMESRISKAVENKNCGYYCAQAVICAYCDLAGMVLGLALFCANAPIAWLMPLNFLKRN